ncbi:MAG: DUF4442 domain-containing protein [Bacteroidota bacterium]
MKPNRLTRLVQRLQPYPVWVRSWMVGRAVKFTGTAGIQYTVMTHEKVVVHLSNKPKVRNHIGQIHAAAMVLLAETATGMALGMHIPDDKIPLIKRIEADFVKRSQGAMQAEAWLTNEQIQALHEEERGALNIAVSITDASGEAPIKTTMQWAWVPKKRT